MSESVGAFVSLQVPTPGATTALEAHRASGILVKPDLALLVSVPQTLLEQVPLGVVLVVPQPPNPDSAEEGEIREVSAFGVRGVVSDDVSVAVRFAPSAAAGVQTAEPFTEDQLRDALRARGGELAAALADLGVEIPDPRDALAGIPAVSDTGIVPREHPQPPRRHDEDVNGLALSICDLLPFCDKREQ